MNNDQVPLYLGVPLAIFLIAAASLIILMIAAAWKDSRD